MRSIFRLIDTLFQKIGLLLITIYQYTLSPDKGLPSLRLKGRVCMHEPHCSEYGKLCLQRYGFFRSIGKITSRVFSCTGGMHKIYDPEFYKVVFFSSAPIGVPFLEKLYADKRFEVTGVVTMPDAPSGRGMKMQENVIKAASRRLQAESDASLRGTKHSVVTKQSSTNRKYHFIILHGLTGRPEGNFLPWLKENLESLGHTVSTPLLPQPDDIAIDEKISFLTENYDFDENTILIGHSLGSLIAMKIIEQLQHPIAGFISVAGMYDRRVTPERKKVRPEKYTTYDDYIQSYGPITWNPSIRNNYCQSIVVSDPNDGAVPLHHQQSLSKLLDAPCIMQSPNSEHVTGDQEPVVLEAAQELLAKLAARSQQPGAEISDDPFIQTPNSLRLDSKKYADEAKAFQQRLAEKKPDFLVVIAYGKIIPQHILDIPTFGPINVHGSILPKYRGASPIQSVFLQDGKETGITIMHMDAGLDTGDMIDVAKFPIAFDWTSKDVIAKMQDIGPQFLVDTLRKYGKGLLGRVKQDDNQATHCGKIDKEDGLIDPYTDSLQSIYNKYRAYILRPKIYFMHGDKRVIIEQLILDEKEFEKHKHEPLISSVIARNPDKSGGRGNPEHNTWIASSQSSSQGRNKNTETQTNPCIKNLTVKPEGSKSQSWDDFVKGYGK